MVVFAVDLQWPYWLSLLLTLGGMALLGALFNLGVYYPLRHRSYLPVIISTSAPRSSWPTPRSPSTARNRRCCRRVRDPGLSARAGLPRQPVPADHRRDGTLVAFQYWFFEHTLVGKKLQATSQDKEMAALLGIRWRHDHADLRVQRGARRHRPASWWRRCCSCRSRWAPRSPSRRSRRRYHRRLRRRDRKRSSAAWHSASSRPSGRPTSRCPTRTPSPSWSSWSSWSCARRACSASAWRRSMAAPPLRSPGPAPRPGLRPAARRRLPLGSLAYAVLAAAPRRARRDDAAQRLRPEHPDAGGDLCHRGDRAHRGARPVRADQLGPGRLLRHSAPTRSASARSTAV